MASLNIVTAWPMPTPPAHWSAPGQPVFVGRRRERSVLDRAWAETQRGIRQFVLVCGEAGAGKSRLVTETANAVHRLGAAVLVGGCALDFGRPYDPVAEPVRSLLPWTTHGGIQLGDEVAAQAEVIDRLRLVAGGVGGSSVNSPRLLFDAVSRLMIEAVGPHPLVLVLEDLQWAAETGVQLVVHLAEAVADVPLLVLATLRSTGPASDNQPALAALYRLAGVHRLDLDPLQTADIADYLHRGHGVSLQVAGVHAPQLRERTGGNPFLLRELCRSWPDDGPAPGSTTLAPATVRATVMARCAGIGPGSLQVLRLAAVLGQQVSATELSWCLAETPDADHGAGSPLAQVGASMLSGIDDAIGAGLLEKVPARADSYRFPHALTRQSVLAAVPELELARLHARVAVALERRLPAGPGAALRLAHYYLGAASLGYLDPAARHLRAAAVDAESRLAFADAAVLFERGAGIRSGPERDLMNLEAARCRLRAVHHPSTTGTASRAETLRSSTLASGRSRTRSGPCAPRARTR